MQVHRARSSNDSVSFMDSPVCVFAHNGCRHWHISYARYIRHAVTYLGMPEQTEDAMAATSIRVRPETRDRLNEIGLRNESFDEIINRILDELETLKKRKR